MNIQKIAMKHTIVLTLILTVFCVSFPAAVPGAKEINYDVEVVNIYPHDSTSFTQGLTFYKGSLYEGTGLYGKSTIREVSLETGGVEKILHLPAAFFGEGITFLGGALYQLTWQSKTGFIYDPVQFIQTGQFSYQTEGWGLTSDGRHLILSDGSSTLYFLEPPDMKAAKTLTVRSSSGEVSRLNELEYINGEIYSNVWETDLIARISPETGRVLGWINLKGLRKYFKGDGVGATNGIAYDVERDRLFVTGKLWPLLFEIRLIPAR